jgi:hypothetical protein
MRAQLWVNMRQALTYGIRLPDDEDIVRDLTGLEYSYNLKNDIMLEKKEDARKRGLASPDLGDALALTYAYPVYPSRVGYDGFAQQTRTEYDPFL